MKVKVLLPVALLLILSPAVRAKVTGRMPFSLRMRAKSPIFFYMCNT